MSKLTKDMSKASQQGSGTQKTGQSIADTLAANKINNLIEDTLSAHKNSGPKPK